MDILWVFVNNCFKMGKNLDKMPKTRNMVHYIGNKMFYDFKIIGYICCRKSGFLKIKLLIFCNKIVDHVYYDNIKAFCIGLFLHSLIDKCSHLIS